MDADSHACLGPRLRRDKPGGRRCANPRRCGDGASPGSAAVGAGIAALDRNRGAGQACPCEGGGTCWRRRRCMPLRRRGVTVVADRESDIYPAWASVPQAGFHLLSRAMHAPCGGRGVDRRLAEGGTLFGAAGSFPVAGRRKIKLPARQPDRAARTAAVEMRFPRVSLACAKRIETLVWRGRNLPPAGRAGPQPACPCGGGGRKPYGCVWSKCAKLTHPRASSRCTGGC